MGGGRTHKWRHFCPRYDVPHLNGDKIESNLSVPGIQGHQESALIKGFEMSPLLICLYASTKIPLGPASESGLDSGWLC